MLKRMVEVDPSTIHGFNPNSPYAQLFLDIFQLTKPKNGEVKLVKTDINRNVEYCEDVSDEDEIEEGEISDYDETIVLPEKRKRKKMRSKHKLRISKNQAQQNLMPPPPAPPRSSNCQTLHQGSGNSPSPNFLDLQCQIELDASPIRLRWIHNLLEFMASRGTPITNSPVMPTAVSINPVMHTDKQALDLYSLYHITMEQAGGLHNCTETKGWKAVAARMKVPVQKAFVLRSIYQKYLFPLEEFQKNRERKVLLPTPNFQGIGQGTYHHKGQGSSCPEEEQGTSYLSQGTSFKHQVQSSSFHGEEQGNSHLGQSQGTFKHQAKGSSYNGGEQDASYLDQSHGTTFLHQEEGKGGKGLIDNLKKMKGTIKKRLGFKKVFGNVTKGVVLTKKDYCQDWNRNTTHPPCTNQQADGGCISNGKFLKHSCSKRLKNVPGGLVRCCSNKHGFHGH